MTSIARLAALTLVACQALAPGAAHAASRFEREVELLVERLALGPGSSVADIGAGKGAFAVALARRVGPEGRVYATEIDPELREKIAERAASEGLANIVVVEARVDGSGLPAGCCDAAFLRGVYHHLTQPEALLASLREALRPGARLAVIDFRPTRWLSLWTPKDVPADRKGHGVDPEIVIREAEAAGFEEVALDEEWPASWLISHYAAFFRSP